MSLKKLLQLFFLFIVLPIASNANEIELPGFRAVDFDLSLQRHGYSEKAYKRFFEAERFAVAFKDIRKDILLFRKQFGKIEKYLSSDSTAHTIPKVVHQIWLGKPMPEKFYPLVKTWVEMEGWEYKLWTEKEVETFVMTNRELFDNAKDYGEQADILRLEILFQEGGLYVDTDFECLIPEFFSMLHDKVDFYIAFEPLEHGGFKICNAIIGSKPGHPLIGKLIDGLEANCIKYEKGNAIERTGPNYITPIIFAYAKNSHSTRDVYFPPTYFYPTNKPEVQNGKCYTFPESVAFHYWTSSWIGTVVPKKSK